MKTGISISFGYTQLCNLNVTKRYFSVFQSKWTLSQTKLKKLQGAFHCPLSGKNVANGRKKSSTTITLAYIVGNGFLQMRGSGLFWPWPTQECGGIIIMEMR